MLNAEKHRGEIIKRDYLFAITKSGNIRNCEPELCNIIGCIFAGSTSCQKSRAKWMLSETMPQTRDQIIAVLDETKGRFSVLNETGEVVECKRKMAQCQDCIFGDNTETCSMLRYKWLRKQGFIK